MECREFGDYNHYIFDLYGTLIDIHTDETADELWRWLADWYAVYGADWSPKRLYRQYRRFCAEEETLLKRETGVAVPEIKLEKVFLRLYREAERRHSAGFAPKGAAEEAAWADLTANAFRVRSRAYLRLFPGTLELLDGLRCRGKRVYLLSNAQAVFTRPEIEQCGLAEAFDDLWLSSDHGMKKPEPAFLLALLAAHGMDPGDAVMIGNDWHDDMGVAAANRVAGVVVNSCRLAAKERRARRKALADRFSEADADRIMEVRNIRELVNLLP